MTSFELKVYKAVSKIPRGKVATYGQIASLIGSPGAARAVGNALHKNADPKNVPCYRVVDSKGRLPKSYAFGGIEGQKNLFYSLKINPEFEISADDNLVVLDVVAKNDDAKSILGAIDIVGFNVSEAFDKLAEEAKLQGFLNAESGNTVNITIVEKDDKKMPTCHLCGGCGTVMCDDCHGTRF